MNQSASTIVPPEIKAGDSTATIAAAIITIPEKASAVFSWTCERALAAGLCRSSVSILKAIPVIHENFVVAIFEIPASQRAPALASLKQTLTELDLLPKSTIAIDRAGELWIILHGLGQGSIKFAEGFLRPEYLEASVSTFKKWNADCLAIFTAVLEEATRKAARDQGENPEAQ